MEDAKELILYPSKWKNVLLIFVSLAFVAGGVMMVNEGKWYGYIAIVFFGCGVPIFLWQLMPQASFLKLKKDGFEYASLFRKHSVQWKDIEGFGIMKQSQSGITVNKMVGWDYVPEYDEKKKSRAMSKAITGIEAGLPDTYGLKAEELMDIMIVIWAQSFPDDE